jgi:hypothetical protein
VENVINENPEGPRKSGLNHFPKVELKSLPHKNQICGSSVSVHKLKINVLLLKIEILEKILNVPQRLEAYTSQKNRILYFRGRRKPYCMAVAISAPPVDAAYTKGEVPVKIRKIQY